MSHITCISYTSSYCTKFNFCAATRFDHLL